MVKTYNKLVSLVIEENPNISDINVLADICMNYGEGFYNPAIVLYELNAKLVDTKELS